MLRKVKKNVEAIVLRVIFRDIVWIFQLNAEFMDCNDCQMFRERLTAFALCRTGRCDSVVHNRMGNVWPSRWNKTSFHDRYQRLCNQQANHSLRRNDCVSFGGELMKSLSLSSYTLPCGKVQIVTAQNTQNIFSWLAFRITWWWQILVCFSPVAPTSHFFRERAEGNRNEKLVNNCPFRVNSRVFNYYLLSEAFLHFNGDALNVMIKNRLFVVYFVL